MSVAPLYPFLAPAGADAAGVEETVLAEVRASSVAKMRDIIALRRIVLAMDGARIAECAQTMAERFAAGGRLIAFGNGGSSTDAQDLARLFVYPGSTYLPLPSLSLTNDVAVLTALGNDVGFDVVFARQIGAFGRPGDIAVGLSTSGNSDNLLAAFDAAQRVGMLTIGLAGGTGGKMADSDAIDHLFVIPSASVHRIQEAQTTVYHVLWELTASAVAAAAADPNRQVPSSCADLGAGRQQVLSSCADLGAGKQQVLSTCADSEAGRQQVLSTWVDLEEPEEDTSMEVRAGE